jgi:hypothetical protein
MKIFDIKGEIQAKQDHANLSDPKFKNKKAR